MMAKKLQIRSNYTQELLAFKSYPKFVHLPYVDVILKNLSTGIIDQSTSRFLIDTGASISIINKRYEQFVKKMSPIDELPIKYGSGKNRNLPIYYVGILIKGVTFEIPVAYDDECHFLLLGHFEFLNYNTYTLFDSLNKRTTFFW